MAPKRILKTVNEIMQFVDKDLSHFVTPRTMKFFHRLGIDIDFLKADPSEWNERTDYKAGILVCQQITVVNDAAERAVKLITDFNRSLTYDEEGKQYLIQVVEHYRQTYSSHTKSSLLQ